MERVILRRSAARRIVGFEIALSASRPYDARFHRTSIGHFGAALRTLWLICGNSRAETPRARGAIQETNAPK